MIPIKYYYKRDLKNNYLVIRDENYKLAAKYHSRMICQNEIYNLLTCKYKVVNNEIEFYYDITEKQSLNNVLLRRKADYNFLFGFLKSLSNTAFNVKNYMLDMEHIVLKPEYIYMDMESDTISFCYYPAFKQNIKQSFNRLTEMFLSSLDYEDRKGVILAYEMYRKSEKENFSIDKVLEDATKKYYAESVIRNEPEEELPEFEEVEVITEPEKPGFFARLFSKREKGDRGNYEALPVFDSKVYEDNESVKTVEVSDAVVEEKHDDIEVFSLDENNDDYEVVNSLLMSENREKQENIEIDTDDFIIGRNTECVDYKMDSRNISAIHSRIFIEDEEYYITDLNSENGTYVNNQMLNSNETVVINNGDKIKLADIEFVFKVQNVANL